MGIKCFFMDPTEKRKRFLRRYTDASAGWDCAHGYHQAKNFLDVVLESLPDYYCVSSLPTGVDLPWPKACACGYQFQDSDKWQVFTDSIYARTDTGEEVALREAPAGAMWYATWMPPHMYWDDKEDSDHLCVKLPDGTDWMVDSRASNCTRLDDRRHRCWHREGIPPNVTATKGPAWENGAGSVQAPGWHGYLRNGELVT